MFKAFLGAQSVKMKEYLQGLVFCILVFSQFIGGYSNTANEARVRSNPQCNTAPIEQKLQRLESLFLSNINIIRKEIRDSTASVNNIARQNHGATNVLNEFKHEIRRLRETNIDPVPYGDNIDNTTDRLEKGIELTFAALTLLKFEVTSIKESIYEISNSTNKIMEKLDKSSIDQIFGNTGPIPVSPKPYNEIPKNCKEILDRNPQSQSGIYLIQPDPSHKPFMVLCEMEAEEGGWLVVHNRYDGRQNFYLGWEDYKAGFGNIAAEFWLGLEKIYELTGTHLHELRIELIDPDEMKSFAQYSYFSIGPENEGYPLKVLGGFRGTAGDSLTYHAGSKFSTKDKDQDSWGDGNCAQYHSGAWWYKSCDKSNLNGKYIPENVPESLIHQVMYWETFKGPLTGLLQARMMIRPRPETDIFRPNIA